MSGLHRDVSRSFELSWASAAWDIGGIWGSADSPPPTPPSFNPHSDSPLPLSIPKNSSDGFQILVNNPWYLCVRRAIVHMSYDEMVYSDAVIYISGPPRWVRLMMWGILIVALLVAITGLIYIKSLEK
eukprot:1092136-Amorphochlora_amoeboformis.AAC.1